MKRTFIMIACLVVAVSCNNNKTGDATEAKSDTSTVAASNSAEDKEERNKKIVLASLDGIKNKNADILLKDAATDMVDYGDGTAPPIKGVDSIKSFLKMWLDALESMDVENPITTADGDYVMMYGTWKGKYNKDIMGMKTAGKSFNFRDVDIFKLNDDGKITEHRGITTWDAVLASMNKKSK